MRPTRLGFEAVELRHAALSASDTGSLQFRIPFNYQIDQPDSIARVGRMAHGFAVHEKLDHAPADFWAYLTDFTTPRNGWWELGTLARSSKIPWKSEHGSASSRGADLRDRL